MVGNGDSNWYECQPNWIILVEQLCIIAVIDSLSIEQNELKFRLATDHTTEKEWMAHAKHGKKIVTAHPNVE